MALVSLILGIGISISFFSTSIQMTDKIHQEFHRFGANIKIRPKFENKKASLTPFDFAELKKIFWKNQIIAATPVVHLQGTLQQNPVTLNGVFITESFPISENKTWETGLKKLCSYWKIKGEWPNKTNEILISSAYAQRLGLQAGSTVVFESSSLRETLTVSGIILSSDVVDTEIWGDVRIAQKFLLTDLIGEHRFADEIWINAFTTPEKKVRDRLHRSPLELSTKEFENWFCTPFLSSIIYQIEKALPHTQVLAVRDITEAQQTVFERLRHLFWGVSLAVALMTFLVVTTTFSAIAFARQREFALMKVLGACRSHTANFILTESLLIGIVGGCGGFLLALVIQRGLSQWLFKIPLDWDFPLMLLAASSVGIIAATLGSTLPMIRLAKISINQRLAGISCS